MSENSVKKVSINVNKLPAPTKRWLHLNYAHLEAELEVSDAEFIPAESNPKEMQAVSGAKKSLALSFVKKIQCGMGDELDSLYEDSGISPKVYYVETEQKIPPVRLSLKSGSVADLVIYAEKKSSSTFIVDFSSVQNQDLQKIFALRTRIYAEEGASVHFVTVNLLPLECSCLDNRGFYAEEGACISFAQIVLGAKNTWTGTKVNLMGKNSSSKGTMAYALRQNQALDVNYEALHSGKGSNSNFDADGALLDSSVKVFRDTINFLTGAENSCGHENEYVLLLGDKVVNKSIPLILCGEEDVEGQHGASIGQMNEKLLFYFTAHGIDENEAKRMMIQAKVNNVCHHIADESLVKQINDYVEENF